MNEERVTICSELIPCCGPTLRRSKIKPDCRIKLGKVAAKVLCGAVLIDAALMPLKDREHAFDGVDIHVVAHVLTG